MYAPTTVGIALLEFVRSSEILAELLADLRQMFLKVFWSARPAVLPELCSCRICACGCLVCVIIVCGQWCSFRRRRGKERMEKPGLASEKSRDLTKF